MPTVICNRLILTVRYEKKTSRNFGAMKVDFIQKVDLI